MVEADTFAVPNFDWLSLSDTVLWLGNPKEIHVMSLPVGWTIADKSKEQTDGVDVEAQPCDHVQDSALKCKSAQPLDKDAISSHNKNNAPLLTSWPDCWHHVHQVW